MSIFIIKKDERDNFEESILSELSYLNIDLPSQVNYYRVYEAKKEIKDLEKIIGNYEVSNSLDQFNPENSFRYRSLPGQFDEHEEMLNKMIKDFLGEDDNLHFSSVIELIGISKEDLEKFKSYYINEIENEIVDFTNLDYSLTYSQGEDLEAIDGFIGFSENQLKEFVNNYSMNLDDLNLVQKYFIEENRNPSYFELNVIDTYWSDHCRHTTFNTELSKVDIEENLYSEAISSSLDSYKDVRKQVYKDRDKKISLMDLATINSKYEKLNGNLNDLDESEEVNACCVNIDVDVNGEDQKWLLYFKNETHNHPTEIEPFGGASTCVGGAIRDPLSGRAHVHQSMRITGAKDPRTPYEDTLENKLAQRTICKKAMEGSADYGNKYGLPVGYAKEYYDDRFEAKRMEVGAMLAASPKENVVRKRPEAGDLVILLGGKTGRDGLGAAVGSSQVQDSDSLTLQGSEVQKGNPIIQRKIQRLFRNPKASKLIKKCNDFGAGGVSVAIGELADGIEIYLDKVPVKYPGLDPAEIALSESQERMAVIISSNDLEEFSNLVEKEDLNLALVGQVNNSGYMTMTYEDREVLRLSREFLDSNGADRVQDALIKGEDISKLFEDSRNIKDQLKDINNASQKAMGRHFDNTIGKATILNPYGGKNRITEQLGMASKIPVYNGQTNTVSVMAMGYSPEVSKKSTYHGAYLAVVESIAKLVALGVNRKEIRLSLQEYFPSLRNEPNRWGLATGAMLGAFQAMYDLNIPAIGGKDSMSGSYEDLDVVPSLISFAVGVTKIDKVISRELKKEDSKIILLSPQINKSTGLVYKEDLIRTFDKLSQLIESKKVLAISTIENKTIENNLVEMAFGNDIGFELDKEYMGKILPGSFLVEVSGDYETSEPVIAKTNNSKTIILDKRYDIDELKEIYISPLEEVYGKNISYISKTSKDKVADKKIVKKSQAKVLIPVITGSFGEYDLYKSFKEYTDLVDFFVIKEELDFGESIKELGEILADYDILALADGAIFGNHPSAGKGLELILSHDLIKDKVNDFVKDSYIIATGNSTLGLIKAGLIENSRISHSKDIEIRKNPQNRHFSEIVNGKVLDKSMSDMEFYTTALSSDTLIIDLDRQKYKDQIVSIIEFEDFSIIDGIKDKSGHIFGTLSNFERFDKDGMVNIEVMEADFIGKLIEKVNK